MVITYQSNPWKSTDRSPSSSHFGENTSRRQFVGIPLQKLAGALRWPLVTVVLPMYPSVVVNERFRRCCWSRFKEGFLISAQFPDIRFVAMKKARHLQPLNDHKIAMIRHSPPDISPLCPQKRHLLCLRVDSLRHFSGILESLTVKIFLKNAAKKDCSFFLASRSSWVFY